MGSRLTGKDGDDDDDDDNDNDNDNDDDDDDVVVKDVRGYVELHHTSH